jgi:hypothetical protein
VYVFALIISSNSMPGSKVSDFYRDINSALGVNLDQEDQGFILQTCRTRLAWDVITQLEPAGSDSSDDAVNNVHFSDDDCVSCS